jgi:putative acetyltransferase
VTFRIEPLDAAEPAAVRLLNLSERYMESLYPPESNHIESVADLKKPNVVFLGCYVHDVLAGCGAVKIVEHSERYGEIKRLYVDEAYRGRGLSSALMARLEAHLASVGVELARLEVGPRQPEAVALYRKLGYVERPPFGEYVEDPDSMFMEKRLGRPDNQ